MNTPRSEQDAPARRRSPTQRRSKERVERILDAASELIVAHGVAELSTRKIAQQAGIPVASIYQYFADVDEVILELVKRDTAEMDAHVAARLAEVEVLGVRSLVETTMRAFVDVYHRRPAFVVIWWRGRTNAAVYDYCREHNKRIAATLHALATEYGLVAPGTDLLPAELAVEVGDRVFELAFAHELRGDPRIIGEGIEIVVDYLRRYATEAGIGGIPVPRGG